MRDQGFKTNLDAELVELIGQAIEAPAHARAAIQSLGVSHGSFYNWLRRGTIAPMTIYGDLKRRVQLAESRREMKLTELVWKAAHKDGKWAAWMLERMYPERWGPYALPGHEGIVEDQMQLDDEVDLEGLSNDELEVLARAAEILESRGEATEAGAIPATAREARPDPVHAVDIPRLPGTLASPLSSGET